MVCRLCLMNLNAEDAIALFETSGNYSETQILKMIAKHFHLALSRDDPVSTSICQNCSEHLEDFHRFWIYVDQKQGTLRNEFLEVKCEVQIYSEGNEESLLDLKNISMEFAESTPVEEFGSANKTDENNVDEVNTVSLAAIDDSASDSIDENISLHALITRSKTKKVKKTNVSKRATRKKKDAEVMLESGIQEKDCQLEIVTSKTLNKLNEETIANFMKLSCDLCNWPADSFHELRTHFQTLHHRSAYVKCCRRSYDRPSKLVEHIKWHKNPDLYKCSICDKQLRSEKSLQMHNETHLSNDELNLSCRICNKTFLSQKCLKNHILKHNSDKDYNCEICNKSFLTAQRLRNHINSIHKNIYPHICDTCGKKFKFKPSFERHILEHQGIVEPPAQCEECGEWLKNKESLRRHRFKHDTVNVVCHICHRRCPSRTALYKHIFNIHKREKNLQCKYCEKSFKLPQSLEEHVAIHTGAQLYSCPHCAKEYRSRANMYVHIKRFHVEEWVKAKMARSHNPNLKSSIS